MVKFGKVVQEASKASLSMPFIRYKLLKRCLKEKHLQEGDKILGNTTPKLLSAPTVAVPPPRSLSFLYILSQDIRCISRYFDSKSLPIQERMLSLEHECESLTTDPCCPQEELVRLCAELTDFHGQLISIQQWTLVNLTAASKILKKHDKQQVALHDTDGLLALQKPCILKPSILKALFRQQWCHSTRTIQAMTTRVESMAKRCLRLTMERSRLLAQRVMSMDPASSSTPPISDASEAESALVRIEAVES